jgi:hypothetical protein
MPAPLLVIWNAPAVDICAFAKSVGNANHIQSDGAIAREYQRRLFIPESLYVLSG